jgi:HEAT repeat protein
LAALSDSHPWTRAAAAEALGRIGDPAALLALRRLIDDDARVIRSDVLSSPSARPLLVSEVVKAASTKIWRSQGLKTFQMLAHYPKETSPDVWQSAHVYLYAAVASKRSQKTFALGSVERRRTIGVKSRR